VPGPPAVGPAVRVALDRRHLARALGLTALTLGRPDQPVAFSGNDRT
jgi:hypothetical protein